MKSTAQLIAEIKSLQKSVELQKLELDSKNRELEIEASLERVRARTMAMHRSEELGVVITEFFNQMNPMGLARWGCALWLADESVPKFDVLFTSPADPDLPISNEVPVMDRPVIKDIWSAYKDQLPHYNLELRDQDKSDFDIWFLEQTGMRILPEEVKQEIRSHNYVQFSFISMRCGLLGAIDIEPVENEKIVIVQRFAKVFDQTYTRFLDLQKAEAQAREAQIEAALERVRSRTMAMQKSEELAEVSLNLFEQVEKLGIKTWSTGFNVWLEDDSSYIDWVVNSASGKFIDPYKVDLSVHPSFMEISSAKKQGDDFFVHETEGKTLEELYRLLFLMAKTQFDDIVKAGFQLPEHQFNHYVFGSKVSLMFITYDPCPEAHDIFKRFGKVFEQTYTRFLDLQKAEAQARESQIEAALERVRSSAMAMHTSEDLHQVAKELRRQIGQLDYKDLETCAIHLYDESEDYFVSWAASLSPDSEFEIVLSQNLFPKKGVSVLEELIAHYKSPEKDYVVVNEGEKMEGFLAMLKKITPETYKVVKNTYKEFALKDYRSFWTVSDFKGGSLLMTTITRPDDGTHKLLRRFADVFGLAYRRFADLKKAEAQAREAQVETGLERVRSRTMGMQRSEELLEVGELVYMELSKLGIVSMTSGVTLVDQAGKMDSYYVVNPDDGSIMKDVMGIPRDETKVMRSLTASWEKQEPFHIISLNEKETILHQTYIAENSTNFPFTAEELISYTPARLNLQTFNFKYGYLILVGAEKLSEEKIDITIRFAKVFEQTYTRFLDLQKAEAQARETQIELALERVRARTMAMQKSDELAQILSKIFEELTLLNVELARCIIWIIDPISESARMWFASAEVSGGTESYFIPNFNHPYYEGYIKAWQAKEAIWTLKITGKLKKSWDKYLFEETELKRLPKEAIAAMRSPETIFTSNTFNQYGLLCTAGTEPLSEKSIVIFQRFGRVFEQSYARFEDIKKAESQAREAQIEAALERIRASALAMHTSDELTAVADVLRQQMALLDQPELEAVVINLYEVDDQRIESWYAFRPLFNISGKIITGKGHSQKGSCLLLSEMLEMYHSSIDEYTLTASGEKLEAFINALIQGMPEIVNYMNLEDSAPEVMYYHFSDFSGGALCMVSGMEPSIEARNLLRRAASVFDLAYRRFLDLQKAEAQAREAEIELALERVRSRTMAMHKSDELREVTALLFQQLQVFGFHTKIFALILIDKETNHSTYWVSDDENAVHLKSYNVPYFDHPLHRQFIASFHEGVSFKVLDFSGEEKASYDKIWFEISDFPEESKIIITQIPAIKVSLAFMKYGAIQVVDAEAISIDNAEILKRFAKVFEQTYTRFLDLQKAEAQAKEAQIEAALERVRSRSMAMHRSDELSLIVGTLYKEMEPFGFSKWACSLTLFNEKTQTIEVWIKDISDTDHQRCYYWYGRDNEMINDLWLAWEAKVPTKTFHFKGEKKRALDNYLFEKTDYAKFPTEVKSQIRSTDEVYFNLAYFKFGYLVATDYQELSTESIELLQRFAKVFEQTYTRFLDIQKAEAQAKEAQIEAALERVRSSMMAMHKSDELRIVVGSVFTQLQTLGFDSEACAVIIYNSDYTAEHWLTGFTHDTYPRSYKLPYLDNPYCTDFIDAWKKGVSFQEFFMEGQAKVDYANWMLENSEFKYLPDEFKKEMVNPERLNFSDAFMCYGMIEVMGGTPLPVEKISILKRFAKVFEQTYTRFLDLQKAEKQARESQIEAALERVRSRSMAMQHSSELNEILAKVFEELTNLDMQLERAVIWIYHPENKSAHWWAANPEADSGTESYLITNQNHPVYLEYWRAWEERRAKYLYILEGENMSTWCDVLFYEMELGRLPQEVQDAMRQPERVYLYNTFNDFGVLYLVCLEPITDDNFSILERFGKVFDQSYTRFKDIKQAEAREKEAIKQSSLDRVRAEIASMRNTEDLQRITPLIWRELLTLGVPFFRCGLMIVDENEEKVRFYLSTPDGKPLAALNLDFENNDISSNGVKYWRKQEPYIAHWNREEFLAFTETLLAQQQITNVNTYQGGEEPPESLTLQFIPFPQGMLYVGSKEDLAPAQLELVKNLADAFSVAYARYEDFKQLETAKSAVESAMNELKATQSQLVQQEKLASLGQLTAGIAHEIKNPLNFVNNFSEVSIEMIQEIQEERSKGQETRDETLVDEILEDIKSNLQKVHQHGSRANGIVTSMLQHSRGGSGKMEPTDLNALIKEYVNLSFHGMRAGKNPINVVIALDLDPDLGMVSLIKEDFTRVVINLCNNAFDACAERSRSTMREKLLKTEDGRRKTEDGAGVDGKYLPKLKVTTMLENGWVRLLLEDNGPGIPDEIKDKILQPFFTTKKGTEGTGLGLSITHDIVKAHGGELSVKSIADEGTTFIIQLPKK